MLRLVDTQTSLDGRIGFGEIREPTGKSFGWLRGEKDAQIGPDTIASICVSARAVISTAPERT